MKMAQVLKAASDGPRSAGLAKQPLCKARVAAPQVPFRVQELNSDSLRLRQLSDGRHP